MWQTGQLSDGLLHEYQITGLLFLFSVLGKHGSCYALNYPASMFGYKSGGERFRCSPEAERPLFLGFRLTSSMPALTHS